MNIVIAMKKIHSYLGKYQRADQEKGGEDM